tara:strand:- start:6619 stop:6828 length:210 start_codon:yes stop_codon:yes gene_type:complete
MIKVEGHPHLYRDEKSGAIINCDSMGYNQYVNSLRQKELQKNELDKMKDDINEIKSLLKKLTMGNNINI